jgi:hypothetical protein
MKRFPLPSVARLLMLTSLAAFGACGSPPAEEAAIGRAIASHLDPLNGLPTAVLSGYQCQSAAEPCRVAGNPSTSAMITAFAEARQIPVLRSGEAATPRCAWAADGGETPGLWAEFVEPPRLQGDTARVLVATACAAEEAFEQVHEFILHRRGPEWSVEQRLLRSITCARSTPASSSGSRLPHADAAACPLAFSVHACCEWVRAKPPVGPSCSDDPGSMEVCRAILRVDPFCLPRTQAPE